MKIAKTFKLLESLSSRIVGGALESSTKSLIAKVLILMSILLFYL